MNGKLVLPVSSIFSKIDEVDDDERVRILISVAKKGHFPDGGRELGLKGRLQVLLDLLWCES